MSKSRGQEEREPVPADSVAKLPYKFIKVGDSVTSKARSIFATQLGEMWICKRVGKNQLWRGMWLQFRKRCGDRLFKLVARPLSRNTEGKDQLHALCTQCQAHHWAREFTNRNYWLFIICFFSPKKHEKHSKNTFGINSATIYSLETYI